MPKRPACARRGRSSAGRSLVRGNTVTTERIPSSAIPTSSTRYGAEPPAEPESGGQHGRDRAACQHGHDRRHVVDGEPDREVLVSLVRPRMLGNEGHLDDADCLRARTQGGHAHEEQRHVSRQHRQHRDGDQGHAADHDHAPADPIRERAAGERHQDARQHRDRHQLAHRRGAEADRPDVQVEVGPVEADDGAVDDGRDEEQPGVAAESGEAPDVPDKGLSHGSPLECAYEAWLRSVR